MPPNPPQTRDLIVQMMRLLGAGRLPEALRLSAEILKRQPNNPRAQMVQGIVAREHGDVPTAITWLERAHHRSPQDPEILFNLGLTHSIAARGHDRARECFEKVLSLYPNSAATHAALAKLHEEINELDTAHRWATRALELEPENWEALMVAAIIDRRLGDLDGSRAKFESLILDQDGKRLQAIPRLTRATVLNKYAAVLDKQRDYARAFEYFEAAQRERWSCPDAAHVAPNYPLQLMDRSERLLTPELLAHWGGFDPDDGLDDPVFLVGFPRSGTTLTEQILDAHPGVVTIDEQTPLTETIKQFRALRLPGDYPVGLERLTPDQVRRLRAFYWKVADERKPGRDGRLLVDKLPLLILHLGIITRLFPRARLIVALRDPRDACLSAVMQVMTPNSSMAHLNALPKAIHFYARVMGHWLTLRERLPLPWIQSRYADLVSDPEPHIRRLIEFLGLEWNDAVLRHHEQVKGKSISTPSYETVAKPINTSSRGRWHHYESRFEGHLEPLRPFLEEFGYTID